MIQQTDEQIEIAPYETSSDANRRTHIVRPTDNGWVETVKGGDTATGQDVVDIARLTGTEVAALCGYRWVPKHDPRKYDACEACIDVAGQIMRGERP